MVYSKYKICNFPIKIFILKIHGVSFKNFSKVVTPKSFF